MKRKILVSLGGNALGTKEITLRKMADEVCEPLVEWIKAGHSLVLCHGNGPQVGALQNAFGTKKHINQLESIELADSVAMTQGYMGYQLENAIDTIMKRENVEKSVATLVTRVIVDPNDPGFQNPTKPVGPFFTKEEAEDLEKAGKNMKEDAGRGYREVVASPIPLEIVETPAIQALLKDEIVVIAGGGGGIPIMREDGVYTSVPAVIDKDHVSAKLAEDTGCDTMVILTGVDYICKNFGTPEQEEIRFLTKETAEELMGEFAEGSMLPKVKAAVQFVGTNKNRRCLITSLQALAKDPSGNTGTWIMGSKELLNEKGRVIF